jgi:hypothetical protein
MNLQPIFWGGLIAGTLDIVAACLTAWLRRGISPTAVLRYIASGVLGPAAATGGPKAAILGLALHFVIATGAAAVFYFASRKFLFLVERPVVTGLLYGIAVYLFMTFIVLPLSFVARGPATLSGTIIGMVTLMICIGLPIALIVRRYSR